MGKFFSFSKVSVAVGIVVGAAVTIVALPDVTLFTDQIDAILCGALAALAVTFFPEAKP